MKMIVTDVDNRDPSTTWFWVKDGMYIEVDTEVLLRAVLENSPTQETFAEIRTLIDAIEQEVR